MTTLHLIRHGRATALQADYDQLHPIGEAQGRVLGAQLASEHWRFDAVYVGPLRRQRHTLQLMREAAGPVAAAWPEERVLDGLAEGPFEALLRNHAVPRLAHDSVLQAHAAVLREPVDIAARDAAMSAIYDHMIALWRSGEVAQDLESPTAFEARVMAALADIAEREGIGREVAVVTSNGVIALLVERADGVAAVPQQNRLRVHNGSITRIELRAGGHTLLDHDITAHFSDPEHLTLL